MKKIYLVFLRGSKSTTVFALSGVKTIDLKTLYKAFTNQKNYPDLLAGRTVSISTNEGDQCDIRIANAISVSRTGLCKVRSTVETNAGKNRIDVQHQLDITNNDIMLKDVNAIMAKFLPELKKYVPTQLIEKNEGVKVTETVEKGQLATA